MEQYIDVIKHDLGKLGYTLSGQQNTNLSYTTYHNYQLVALGACSSGSTGSVLDSVIIDSTHGPALRVSD